MTTAEGNIYRSLLTKLAVYTKTLPNKKHDLRKQIMGTFYFILFVFF